MTVHLHEKYPGNSKAKQKRETSIRHREAVLADSPDYEEEGKELIRRKVLKTAGARPRVRKKTFLQRIGETVGTNSNSIGYYLIWDIIVPAAKSMINDAVIGGVEMALFGENSGRGSSRHRRRNESIVSYGSFFEDRQPRSRSRRRSSSRRDYVRVPPYHNRLEGISFERRGDAEAALDALIDVLEKYEVVSIADFYEIADIATLSNFTDQDWGWDNLSSASVIHTRDGFIIDFPDPIELD